MGTLTTLVSRNPLFVPNGSTTNFAYNFKIFSKNDLEVLLRTTAGVEELQTVDSDYTVNGVGDDTGGSIDFITAPSGTTHDAGLIRRKLPRTQTLDLLNGGDLPSDNMEKRYDRAIMMIQELEERLDRSLHFKKTTSVATFDLPELVADKFFKISSDGLTITFVDALTTGAISVTAFMQTLLDDADGEVGMRTLVGTAGHKIASLFAGMTVNLGITLVSGVLTVTDAAGSALSAANPGYICMHSTTDGKLVFLKVTAPYKIEDFTGTSDLTGYGWGITKTVDWAKNVPFFLGAINKGNTDFDGTDGNSSLFFTRAFALSNSPGVAGEIGDTTAIPTTDNQNAIILMADNMTQANYTGLPVLLIGTIQAQWDTSDNAWTFQGLSRQTGIGQEYMERQFLTSFDFPLGQNGAASSTHLKANGGTAPVFTTSLFKYQVNQDGFVTISLSLNDDAGTDGAGAVTSRVSLPYKHAVANTLQIAVFSMQSVGTGKQFTMMAVSSALDDMDMNNEAGAAVQNGDFTNGARNINGSLKYKAY